MHMNCADTEKFLLKFLPLIKDIGIERNIVIAPPFTAISTFCANTNFKDLDIYKEL